MTRQAPATTADRAPRTDGELLAAVRAQQPHAFQDLRDRHWPTAVAVAGLHTPTPQDAEQLAGTAVDQVVADLSGEDAPGAFLRARLVDVVGRAAARSPYAAEAVTGVFLGLPPDRQAVLWHADVEGLEPAQVAGLLGRTAAATTALHLEARAGLRAAYRRARLEVPATTECEALAGDLGALVGGTLTGEQARRVQQHLDDCPRCAADHLYLQDTEAGLRDWLLPVLAGVSPWGAKAQEIADLVRAAGRVSAERVAAGPGADVAGRALAAVAVSRRGRQVLLGAGALAAAAALAGVAVTGQGGAAPQAADPRGAETATPGNSASAPSAGFPSTTGGEDEPSADGDAGQVLSLPATEPSPGPLTEPAAQARRAESHGGAVLTAGGRPAQDGDAADRAGSGAGDGGRGTGRTGGDVPTAPDAGTTGSSTTNGTGDTTTLPARGGGAAGAPDAGAGGRESRDTTEGTTSAGGGTTSPAPPATDTGGSDPSGSGAQSPAPPVTESPAPPATDTGGSDPSGSGAQSPAPPATESPAPPTTESPAPPAPDTAGQAPDTQDPESGPLPPAPEPGPLLPASPPPGVPGPPAPEDLLSPVIEDLAPDA